ncbi:MAG: cytochrome c3 family protein [Candidatus Thiodiazotropha sp.]
MKKLSYRLLSIVALALLSSGIATGAEFEIEKALWKVEKSLLIVEAKAKQGQTLLIENAYDPSQVLADTRLRKDALKVRLRSPRQLPCRIRVINKSLAQTLERDVISSETKKRPEGCFPTAQDEPPPAENQAPIANAGLDQVHKLEAGQTSLTVTLDGSGSTDPDGSIAGYIWQGTPDPDDVVSPVISLGEGTHKYNLVVSDDQDKSSLSDTVRITVEAAPVEPPPPAEPPKTAAEAHAAITTYEGPSTCIACHEDEAVAMHGSVHYQQSGDAINLTNDVTPFSKNGLPRAGERGDGAIGINTYCGSHENSPRFTCAGCHVGNGRFPNSELPLDETERKAELNNIDCLMCHQDSYKRFPTGEFEPLEIVAAGADGKPDPNLDPLLRIGSKGVPVVDRETLDFLFEPADAKSTLVSLGGTPMMQDRVSAAQTVHATTRKSCLNCHAKAGGGDGTKRGDLSSALINPGPQIDIHMSSSGENLTCADCHDAGGHRLQGRGLDLRPNDVAQHFTCESCHDRPHGDYSNRIGGSRDKHATRIACQTCHIPTYAKGVATETNRDWEDPHFSAAACNGRGGWLPREDKALNLTPTYQWFDGTSQVYVLGENLADYPMTMLKDGSEAITLGLPNGWVNTQNAKIYPMKEHTSNSAVHDASNSLIAHSTYEFFRTGSFDSAVQSALEQTGRAGDSYTVKRIHTFQTINHGVEDSSAALGCGSCHASLAGGPLRMDLVNDLGYDLKGNEAEVCTQCHENKGGMSFSKLHEKHVKDKGVDCSTCHNFTRPERGLNGNIASFIDD